MIQDHYVVPKVDGVTGNHHNLSHHGQDGDKIKQLQKIEREIIGCFGSLVGQMKSKSESGSTLLDNTSILFGSNLGNANAHHARNLPIFLAGGGFKHGQFVQKKNGTPFYRTINQNTKRNARRGPFRLLVVEFEARRWEFFIESISSSI